MTDPGPFRLVVVSCLVMHVVYVTVIVAHYRVLPANWLGRFWRASSSRSRPPAWERWIGNVIGALFPGHPDRTHGVRNPAARASRRRLRSSLGRARAGARHRLDGLSPSRRESPTRMVSWCAEGVASGTRGRLSPLSGIRPGQWDDDTGKHYCKAEVGRTERCWVRPRPRT
jgi:hypothetical protein